MKELDAEKMYRITINQSFICENMLSWCIYWYINEDIQKNGKCVVTSTSLINNTKASKRTFWRAVEAGKVAGMFERTGIEHSRDDRKWILLLDPSKLSE